LRIQQDGSESVRLSVDGGFVVVGVPVVMSTDAVQRGAVLRYSIGTFLGRETPLPTRHARANLSLRIPKELFRPGERLKVEVVSRDGRSPESTIWDRTYEAGWLGTAPHLEPLSD
jgi:hypothetical protein